MIIIKY